MKMRYLHRQSADFVTFLIFNDRIGPRNKMDSKGGQVLATLGFITSNKEFRTILLQTSFEIAMFVKEMSIQKCASGLLFTQTLYTRIRRTSD